MIGTHNSLTCCSAKHIMLNMFSFMWKCQSMSIEDQLKYVDYFDIRVRFNSKGKLVFCHGLIDLKVKYTFNEIMNLLSSNNKKCRILLEKGEDKGLMNVLNPWIRCGTVSYVIVKKGWKVLYGKGTKCKDYSYVPFLSNKSFWWNIKHMKWSTIKKWSKKYNPIITEDIMKSNIVYFMDYFKIK